MRRSYLLLLLCTSVPAACSDEPPPRIGVSVSTAPGQAATIAAAELQPGVPGYFEALIAEITSPASDAEQAITQAYSFVNDRRVIAVVGHANSAASLAASQIYNDAGLVQIAPTTTAPVYGQAGRFSFRLVPGDGNQAAYLAKARRHHWPDSRIAVVHVNDDYGRGLLRALRPQLDSVVFEGVYADGNDSIDIARLSAAMLESRPELLMWLGRPRALGMLLPRLRAELPDIAVVCADACDVPVVYANRNHRFDGIHFVRFVDPASPDPAVRKFRRMYLERTGEAASSEALLTYDAVSLVRAAIRDGARSREDVRKYLASLGGERPRFQGLTGSIAFDSSGAFARAYSLALVQGDSVTAAHHAMHHREY